MQRWTLFATLATALMLGACTGDAGEATPTPQPTKTMSPAGRQSVKRQAEEAMRLREVNQQETENTMSPYRYVVSTERYSTFGKLLKRSTHSKTVHAMGVTLLAPTNEAFEDFEDWKLLLGKGNQAMLDEFVAHHVVRNILSYESFKNADEHGTLAGVVYDVSRKGGITFNGAHVRSGEVRTENGMVLGMDDVVFIPMGMQ